MRNKEIELITDPSLLIPCVGCTYLLYLVVTIFQLNGFVIINRDPFEYSMAAAVLNGYKLSCERYLSGFEFYVFRLDLTSGLMSFFI